MPDLQAVPRPQTPAAERALREDLAAIRDKIPDTRVVMHTP
jgi:hypothetical protein